MAIKDLLRTIFSSKTKQADDGREQWPSRVSFILAAMGGCVGLGNILRYVGLSSVSPYIDLSADDQRSHRKCTTTLDYSGS